MLELFFKHLDFIGVKPVDATYIQDEKYIVKYNDPTLNKHWLSFYATHKAGYKQGRIDALNHISIQCINELNNV